MSLDEICIPDNRLHGIIHYFSPSGRYFIRLDYYTAKDGRRATKGSVFNRDLELVGEVIRPGERLVYSWAEDEGGPDYLVVGDQPLELRPA